MSCHPCCMEIWCFWLLWATCALRVTTKNTQLTELDLGGVILELLLSCHCGAIWGKRCFLLDFLGKAVHPVAPGCRTTFHSHCVPLTVNLLWNTCVFTEKSPGFSSVPFPTCLCFYSGQLLFSLQASVPDDWHGSHSHWIITRLDIKKSG